MRGSIGSILVSWVLATAHGVIATSPPGASALASVPQCGTTCIATIVTTKSTCELTDFACVCSNATLSKEIEACIFTSCTPREALTTGTIVNNLCGVPKRNKTLEVRLVPLLLIIFSTLFYAARLMSRVVLHQKIDISDIILGVSVVLTFPFLWTAFSLADHGLGKEVWDIPQDNITVILQLYWTAEIFYVAALPLTRISFLCFYLKLFPQKAVRTISLAMIGLNVATLIAFTIASIFQCYPIRGAWTFWDGSFTGHCNDINLQSWLQAGVNIAEDLLVIILPLPLVSKLSTSRGRKINVIVMFSLGFFITIISAIRLKTLVLFQNSNNISYDYADAGVYSIIEASVGIICACLPTVRALVITLAPPGLFTNLSISRPRISGGKTPKGGSTGQGFDRLEDRNSDKSPIETIGHWSSRNNNKGFNSMQSESNVELVTVDAERRASGLGSDLQGKSSNQSQSTNWSRPL
ncbi:hypothetical protein F4777DRAFT_351117 [Nemania sp. FL0916]|nr:hypothetical protein F4777DRAFT_351117 [Nemania sp. FL0916]